MHYHIHDTWLSRVNPSLKLMLTIGFFIFLLFIHNPNVLIPIVAAFFLMNLFFSGHPKRYVLLYILSFGLLFISASVTMVFFGQGQTTWVQFGLLHITEESFYRGIHIGLRATVFALAGLLFVLTTKPVLLFYSLMQQLKLPATIAYAFMATIRMFPMMIEEFHTLRHAYLIRGMNRFHGKDKLFKKFQFYTLPLLAQALRRAQRLAIAMEAKQFTVSSKQRTFFYNITYSYNDLMFLMLLLAIVLASQSIGETAFLFPITNIRE